MAAGVTADEKDNNRKQPLTCIDVSHSAF